MTSAILTDTSAFYALVDRNDRHHVAAREFLAANTRPLITSEYVFDEAVTLIRYDFGHSVARTIGERIRASQLCTIVPIETADIRAAWEQFCRYADQDFSFTDCTSFALMSRLKLQDAFTFDHHFWTAGFNVVPGG